MKIMMNESSYDLQRQLSDHEIFEISNQLLHSRLECDRKVKEICDRLRIRLVKFFASNLSEYDMLDIESEIRSPHNLAPRDSKYGLEIIFNVNTEKHFRYRDLHILGYWVRLDDNMKVNISVWKEPNIDEAGMQDPEYARAVEQIESVMEFFENLNWEELVNPDPSLIKAQKDYYEAEKATDDFWDSEDYKNADRRHQAEIDAKYR